MTDPAPPAASTSRWKALLASIMPGLFLVGYNIGTGSVTAMAKAGADYGLALLWTVLLSCLATYYLILLFSRYTMVTGETVLYGIRKHLHPALALLLMFLLLPIILSALMGVLGIVAESLHVWSRTWSRAALPEGISAKWWAVLCAILCYALLWDGRVRFFQKVLVVLVALMGLSFLLTAILYFPPLPELLWGFVPKPPPAAPDDSNTNGMMVMAGMIGTTVSVFAFLIRSGSIREAGWSVADMGVQRRDAAMSASLMFVLSAAIVMTASATIHAHRLRMNEIADMVRLMEPIAGWIATTAFVVGIVAAGLSSHMPNMLVVPWFIRDYLGKERSTDTAWDRTVLFFLSLFSLLGTFLGFKPIPLMIFSQACIAVMLPLALGAVIVLTSRKSLMGRHANGIVDYIILSCIMVFALFMGYVGIQGVWNKLI